MIVSAEVNMKTWVFQEDDGNVIPMTASNGGLGQIMAVIMIIVQILEVAIYYSRVFKNN